MFRKDFFVDNNLYYDESCSESEDCELWLRAFEIGLRIGCVEETLFEHRRDTKNTVNMKHVMIVKNFLQLNVEIPSQLLEWIAPRSGKIPDSLYPELEKLFSEIQVNNDVYKKYDPTALSKVLALRLYEAKYGYIGELAKN